MILFLVARKKSGYKDFYFPVLWVNAMLYFGFIAQMRKLCIYGNMNSSKEQRLNLVDTNKIIFSNKNVFSIICMHLWSQLHFFQHVKKKKTKIVQINKCVSNKFVIHIFVLNKTINSLLWFYFKYIFGILNQQWYLTKYLI